MNHAPSAVVDPPQQSTAPTDRWLLAEGRGSTIVIRSRSADDPQPADWIERLGNVLERVPSAVAVGAKRLDARGRVFSMGEQIIHPKSFHHLGREMDGEAYRFPEEVDAILGGVLVVDAGAFARVGGADLLRRPLGLMELCLALRADGGRCIVTPDAIVTDECSPLTDRSLIHDDHDGFMKRWGFDWRAADLDAVREKHAGLLWNVRFAGPALPFSKYEARPAMHWVSYAEVDVYRQRADHLARVVGQAAPGALPRVLDLGCGDGLFAHLFARAGARVTGIDPEASAIEQAQRRVSEESAGNVYPEAPPQFIKGAGEALPAEKASFDVIAMLDVIEHLPNPVAVLREVRRVLAPGGRVVVSTPAWQYGGSSDAVYHVCEYTLPELVNQVQASTGLRVQTTGTIGGVYRDLVLVAEREFHDAQDTAR